MSMVQSLHLHCRVGPHDVSGRIPHSIYITQMHSMYTDTKRLFYAESL